MQMFTWGSMPGSSVPPDTSFTISAPAPTACFATSALNVSMESSVLPSCGEDFKALKRREYVCVCACV